MYYYRANRVICRYQIALHDPVDPALAQALARAFAAEGVTALEAAELNEQ